MVKKIASISAVVFFSLLSVIGFFHSGFPPTHDGEYHLIRFYEFYKTLTSGVIYPRLAEDLNFGYGLPLFIFVYPFPNYIAALIHLLGFSFIEAFKYNFILSSLLGAAFMYFLVKELFGMLSGVVASAFFSFCPYHLVDLYIRGSVGEAWSLAFVPGILWMILKLKISGNSRYYFLSAILIAFLIFSHNILALLFFPFLISFSLFLDFQKHKKKESIIQTLLIFAFGMGLSAIFWIPALAEKKLVTGLEIYNFSKQFPDLYSLLFPSWGTGFAGEGGGNAMSTQVGLANILVVFLSIALIKKFYHKKKILIVSFLLGWFFLVSFLMLSVSASLWNIVPLFHFAQFPWRYLSVIVILCGALAGALVSVFKRRVLLALLLLIILLATTNSYTKFAYYHMRDDNYYISRSNFIDGTNSPGNAFNTVYVRTKLARSSTKAKVILGDGVIQQREILPQEQKFEFVSSSHAQIDFQTLYFPGWVAFDNKKKIDLVKTNSGLMRVSLSQGRHFITLRFADTMVRGVAGALSLFSLIVLCLVTIIIKKRQYEDSN